MDIILLTELKHQIERLKLHFSIENRIGRKRARRELKQYLQAPNCLIIIFVCPFDWIIVEPFIRFIYR